MGCSSSTAAKSPATKTLMSPNDGVKSAAGESQMDTTQVDVIKLLNEVFDKLDKNGDGFISREELSASMILSEFVMDPQYSTCVKALPQHIRECGELQSRTNFKTLVAESGLNPYFNIFEQLDTNKDGKISREEFQAQLHPSKATTALELLLKQEFDRIDANKDGSLSRQELSAAFQQLLTCSEVRSRKNVRTLMVDAGLNPDFHVFEELDANNDGKVTWEEFRSKMQTAPDIKEFLKDVFNKLDANGDGHVSKEELTASFTCVLECSHLQSKKSFRTLVAEAGVNPDFYVFEQLDTNQDGRITWEEFEANLGPKPTSVQPEPAIAPVLKDSDVKYIDPNIDVVEQADKTTICCM